MKLNYKITKWYPIIGIVFVTIAYGLCLFAAYKGNFVPILLYGTYWSLTTLYDLWQAWQKVKGGGGT